MRIFDAHFHIFDINSEKNALPGICCAADEKEWCGLIALSGKNTGIIPCLGIHPWNVCAKSTAIFDALRRQICGTGAFIGETGLDALRPGMVLQERFFAEHLRIAAETGRPAIIHCVRAWGRLLSIIQECRPGKFMIHSYNGSIETMEKLLETGGWFSFGPRLAFPGEKKCRAAFLHVPGNRFLLESEGGKSQQEGLAAAARAAAEIKKIPESAIIAAANENYINFTSAAS